MSATTLSHANPVRSQVSALTDSTLSTLTANSSESSDLLESDYEDEEEILEQDTIKANKNHHESDEEDDDDEDDNNGSDDDDEDAEEGDENKLNKNSHIKEESEESEEEVEEEEEENDKDDDDGEEERHHNETDKCRNSALGIDIIKAAKDYEINDFQILKTIGTGTFGRVCLCKDKRTDSYCAMKVLVMTDVIRLKQVEHVKNERNILAEVKHPFIVNLLWSSKDDCCLYMLFEYVCGGELFSYLRNAGRFSSQTANFYASEIVVALDYLHSLSIVYRDLKPENLLINRDGHLKITDFGFAKKLKDRTWTLCGTPEYLAPEIIQSKGHNKAVDWWALGVLIYEMLAGYPPFYDDNPFGIYEKILSGKIEWPRHMDPVAKDLIKKLLVLDRTKRMGNMKNGAEDIKRHRWFKHLNWSDVLNKKSTPPIMPEVNFDGDTSNFDEYPETDWKAARSLDQSELQLFDDF